MDILVTGATGFIGRHVVPALIKKGHNVRAVSRNEEKAKSMPWWKNVSFINCDLHSNLDFTNVLGMPDVLIHLAWTGLPNYKKLFHIEENLPADYRFIKSMVSEGIKQVIVAGTCFEYGRQEGCLSEDDYTAPCNAYGLAKDMLHKSLKLLQEEYPFVLQWVRFFYLHGEGQHPKSLLSQLDEAIKKGESEFLMTGGEQLRDYLHVKKAAERVALLAEHPECCGAINCCNGKPISIRRLVEEKINECDVAMKLKLGSYSYADYEPMAFWGDGTKLRDLMKK